MAQFDHPDSAGSGPQKATVKWFNASKGFGFVTLDNGNDAFCHASALGPSATNLPPGATLMCNVAQGQRGLQVTTVHSVDLSTATEEPMGGGRGSRPPRDNFGGGGYGGGRGFGGGGAYRDRDRNDGGYGGGGFRDRNEPSGPMGDGHVKFFNEQKGFGFVVPADGRQDIYLHASALRRSGLSTLAPEQKIRFSTRQGNKGVEVDRIELA